MKFCIRAADGPANGIAVILRALAASALLSVLLPAAAQEPAAHSYKSGDYEYTIGPPPAWVKARDVAASWDEKSPGTSGERWRNWLIDSQIERRQGKRERYFDRAFEAVSSELVQDAGKYQVWFSPDHQRLTLHRAQVRRDGVWQDRLAPKSITLARRESEFERDMSNGMVSALVVLDDVRAGDVVRISYTISGDNPILAGLVDEELVFGAPDPILDRHARVLFDGGAKLAEQRDRAAPGSSQQRKDGTLEWSADAHGIAGIIDESSYPVWYNAAPYIAVGERHTWSDVAAWARALYPPAQPLPKDLQEQIESWRKLPDAEQRIAAALRAIQEDVRYFGVELGASTHKPSEPAETWTRRYGDCKDKARLLATVLQQLGVDAHPALVSAQHGKAVGDLPPAASVFDHVIVEVRLADAVLWLDATLTQQRGSPRLRVPGDFGFALPIAADVHDLAKVVPPPSSVDRMRINELLQPEASGTGVRLSVESAFEGSAADRMRRELKLHGSEATQRSYLDYYRKRYGDVSAETALAVDEDEEHDELRLHERYLLKNPWTASASGEQVLEVHADAVAGELSLPKTAERRAPLAVAYPVELEHRTQLELPPGWRWLSEPMQRTLEDGALTLEYSQAQADRMVSVTETLRTHQSVVQPEDYPKHFALLRNASELVSRRLLLGVAPRDAQRQREKRLNDLMRNILDDKPATPPDRH